MLLLSSCQLGTGGKAIVSIGGVNYLPVYQCEPEFKGVVNYMPSTEECPRYDWTSQSYARANCGITNGEADGGGACAATTKEQSQLGYLKQLQAGTCGAGQIKIIHCLVKTPYSEKKLGKVTRYTFNNDYLSTEQAGCIEGDKVKDVGCAEASPAANTKPIYLCTPQKHLDFGAGKYRWNYFASTSNNCGGWGANNRVNLGNWIQAPTAAPAVVMPILTDCEKLQNTNADWKAKIAATQQEISNLQEQIASVR